MNSVRNDIPRRLRGGVNRTVAIMLVLIAAMLIVIAIPYVQAYNQRAQILACEAAMKSASDGLVIDYLDHFEEGSVEDAMATLDQVMVARPDICPTRGEVYLVRNDKGIFEPVCGLHNPDTKLRVRLNASRAMDLLREELRFQRRYSDSEPESVEITLNGKPLECVRVGAVERLRRGTGTTSGYEGIVCFYGIAGDGDFKDVDLDKGDICYFVYADENHAAVWRSDKGWTGDAYK